MAGFINTAVSDGQGLLLTIESWHARPDHEENLQEAENDLAFIEPLLVHSARRSRFPLDCHLGIC